VGTAYGDDVSFTTSGSSGPDVYVAGIGDNGGSNGIATVWKNGVPTFLTNGANDAEARHVFVSGADVYVVGRETIGAVVETRVWKNGSIYNFGGCANAEAVDIFVSGTDVYVAGIENCSGSPNAKLTVWKNGVATALTDGTFAAVPNSLAVSGTDVYVSGEENNVQKIWKNAVATNIPNSNNSPYGWENAVYASGTDAYVAYNSNVPNSVPKIWKNGVVTDLANGSVVALVHDVFVSGTNVYAVGSDPASGFGSPAIAVMWKNGVKQALTNGINEAVAESVFVFGTDVYIAGSEGGFGGGVKLWKNGTSVSLAGASYAYSVFVK
jgi:hypothetical protein